MPFFSIVAMSASITLPRLHSSMKAAQLRGCRCAACVASGCSAATAQKVTPMIVSARVVNTHSLPSPIGLPSHRAMSCGNAKRTPSLLPIQFACIDLHALGPAGHLVEIVEQLVGVVA